MSSLEKFAEEINNNRTAWIQQLSKDSLLEIFEELHIPTENLTLEVLRKQLRDLVKSGKLSKKEKTITSNSENFQSISEPDISVTSINTNRSVGYIEQFDGNNYDIFEQQLECIISLNDIPPTKKTPLLLTHLTPKVLETLNHLCTPVKPLKKSYEELLSLLAERYNKSTSTTLDRALFRSRNQTERESVEEYIIELKKLAKRCNFKDQDDQVKEKFIDGVKEPLVKFELLKNGDISLDQLILMARTNWVNELFCITDTTLNLMFVRE